jgi:hypothetical protein
VLDVLRWAEIRRMREVEGLSIREIARRTGHDRNTVRRALRRSGPPHYKRPSRDRNGDGVDYLTSEVGMTPKVVNSPGTNAHVWISDGLWVGAVELFFSLFDLRHGAVGPTNRIILYRDFGTNPRKYLDQQSQAILYRRVRAPREDYWWR